MNGYVGQNAGKDNRADHADNRRRSGFIKAVSNVGTEDNDKRSDCHAHEDRREAVIDSGNENIKYDNQTSGQRKQAAQALPAADQYGHDDKEAEEKINAGKSVGIGDGINILASVGSFGFS